MIDEPWFDEEPLNRSNREDFPRSPKIGQIHIRKGIRYICTSNGNTPVWSLHRPNKELMRKENTMNDDNIFKEIEFHLDSIHNDWSLNQMVSVGEVKPSSKTVRIEGKGDVKVNGTHTTRKRFKGSDITSVTVSYLLMAGGGSLFTIEFRVRTDGSYRYNEIMNMKSMETGVNGIDKCGREFIQSIHDALPESYPDHRTLLKMILNTYYI